MRNSTDLLLIPGPVQLHPQVSAALARPMIYHRSPDFAAILAEAQKGLKYVFQTSEPVVTFSSSGTGAMEAAVVNFFSPGDPVLVIVAGKFGERWAELSRVYGLDVHQVDVPWGKGADPADVARHLKQMKSVKGVFIQACETSTGVKHPVREIAQLAHQHEALIVVDAVSALGVFDVPMDAWELDVVVAGSQKGMMLPPGLSFIAASGRAKIAQELAKLPRYYFDLRKEREAQLAGQSAYTPAVSLFYALEVGLKLMMEEGLERIFARLSLYSRATRAAAAAMGLELYCDPPAETVTALHVPNGLEGGVLIKYMQQKCHVRLAGGQGELKGKILRMGHVGYLRPEDILTGIAALEMALEDFGWVSPKGKGAGLAAAEDILAVREDLKRCGKF